LMDNPPPSRPKWRHETALKTTTGIHENPN
jgi:hypothetical protein